MKYFLCVALPIVAAILVVASPALGGGIRGSGTNINNDNDEVRTNNDLSIEEVRRILLEDNEDNDDEEESESEDEDEDSKSESEEEEYVPIVSEDCADTEGLVEVAVNQTLNCRHVRKSKLCDRQHNGKHLYESCQKSCEICIELIPTTDAPTQDLAELVMTDMPTEASYKSYAPSMKPTSIITNFPTVSQSHYPTTDPTTMIPEMYIVENETEEPTYEKILDVDFDATIDPTKYDSAAPSESPTINFTDEPTESPSHYPTMELTNLEELFTDLFDGLDDDAMLDLLHGDINY